MARGRRAGDLAAGCSVCREAEQQKLRQCASRPSAVGDNSRESSVRPAAGIQLQKRPL